MLIDEDMIHKGMIDSNADEDMINIDAIRESMITIFSSTKA
mgnify:CR=1 FL=1|tara:strand:- start:90 stop:212 length:123 start_codon:yes stop_codon:yes gene_type:complete